MAAQQAADAPKAQAPGNMRRPEMEDWLNRNIYHPLAYRLALVLRPTGIAPNAVSLLSFSLIIAAGAAYVGLAWPTGVAIGLLLHTIWHVVDGADGDLARLTGKSSPSGELIDGLCDYIGHFFLYVILGVTAGGWAYLLGTAAGLSRILQANHCESQRRTYLWRAYGVPWLRQAEKSPDALFERRGALASLLAAIARLYIRLDEALSGRGAQADALVERLSRNPDKRDEMRAVCRRIGRASLVLPAWLSANPRTLLLGASMALGSPLWYFLLECTLMHVLLAVSIRRERRINRELAAALMEI